MIVRPVLLAVITLANLTSITIHTMWSGLGPHRESTTIIARDDSGAFLRNGSRLPLRDVQTFLDALQRPPVDTFDVARTGFTPEDLIDHLADAEGYLDDAITIPQVRSIFENSFLDFDAFRRWLVARSCIGGRMIDDYPSLRVDVRTTSGTVEIRSDFPDAYMLPLQIKVKDATVSDCDPGLSRAIAQLMPIDAADRSNLTDNQDVFYGYAYQLTLSPAVSQAIARYGISPPEMERMSGELGLTVQYEMQGNPPVNWGGTVWLRGLPQMQTFLPGRSSSSAFHAKLASIAHQLNMLKSLTWFRNAISDMDDVRVDVGEYTNNKKDSAELLYRAGSVGSAAALARKGSAPISIRVWRKHQWWADWWLLSNGDMLLDSFNAKLPPFGFSKAWYARIPLSSFGDHQVSGVIVHPDGQSIVP